MSGSMAAFIAGLGGGYIKAQDKAREQARQDEIDSFERIKRGRLMAEWKEADQLKQDIRDAAAPRTTMSGYLTQSADGQKLFSAGAGQAAQLKSMQDGIAELEGVAPATQTQGHAITGNMSRGHQIGAGAAPDVSGMNSTDSVVQRMAGVHMRHGNADKALLMENEVMDQKAKRLGLKHEEAAWADKQFNDRLSAALSQPGNWFEHAARVATEAQVGGLAGLTISPKISADGKTVTFVATDPDGKAKEVGSYETSSAGAAKYLQASARAPLETKIGWLVESAKRDAEAAKEAEATRRWEAEFGLRRQQHESDQQYRNRTLQIQGAQEARAAEAHRANMTRGANMNDVDAVFSKIYTTKDAMGVESLDVESALNSRIIASGLPEFARGDALGAAYKAANIYKAALEKSGGNHDKAMLMIREANQPQAQGSQAPASQPLTRQAVPQRQEPPMSAFAKRQQAAMEMERRQRAEAEAQERARLEAERQRRLQGRPDLQQMGGQRYFN